jgi:hypothetical protein
LYHGKKNTILRILRNNYDNDGEGNDPEEEEEEEEEDDHDDDDKKKIVSLRLE